MMKKHVLIQKIAFFIMVIMNGFCVLSSRERLLENYKHDGEMAAISPADHEIHSSAKVKQRWFTPPSTKFSTENHIMSEKKKSKDQNTKSYSPTKRDVQSVFLKKHVDKFYNKEISVKQPHFPKENIQKDDTNSPTDNFMLTKQYYISKQKKNINLTSKEKYSLIQDAQKQMLKELEFPSPLPTLPAKTTHQKKIKIIDDFMLTKQYPTGKEKYSLIQDARKQMLKELESPPKTTHQKKIKIIKNISIEYGNLHIEAKNLLTTEEKENQLNLPQQDWLDKKFLIKDIALEYTLGEQKNMIHLDRKKSGHFPSSSLWKAALQLNLKEPLLENVSNFTDAYNTNLKNLNGTHKFAYKKLFKLYEKVFFQGGSPQRILIAKDLVKFFTAQQLEAIEITAHLKNILNAPLAPSRYKKFYQNQMGNIFYYTKKKSKLYFTMFNYSIQSMLYSHCRR